MSARSSDRFGALCCSFILYMSLWLAEPDLDRRARHLTDRLRLLLISQVAELALSEQEAKYQKPKL